MLSRQRIILAGFPLTLVMLGAVALAIWQLRNDAVAQTNVEIYRLGAVLAEQADRTFQAADLVLKELVETVAESDVRDAAGLRAEFGGRDVQERLRRRLPDIQQVEAFAIIDADGHPVSLTRVWPAPAISFADRPYIRHFASVPDAGSYIEAPVVNRIDGSRTVYLARRLETRDGAFLGVVNASIRLSYYDRFYSALRLGAGTSITIVRRDGVVLVHHPESETPRSTAMPANSQWYPVVAKGGGLYRSEGDLTGTEPRYVSVRLLANYPLVVDVGRLEGAALAYWRQQAIKLALGAIVAACCAFALLWATLRQFRRVAAADAATRQRAHELEASQKELAEKSTMLAATLEHMDQGILLVTPDRRVPICNRRLLEMLDLPPEFGLGHSTIDDFQDAQDKNGEFATFDPALQARIRAFNQSRAGAIPDNYIRTRPNGTVLEIHNFKMQNGNLVRCFSDITRRTRAEARLRQAQRHEAVGQLTAGIAHDFNNILAVVVGNLELTAEHLGAAGLEAGQYVEEARDAAMVAAGLVSQLLAFSGQQDLHMGVTDLASLLHDTLPMLRQAVANTLDIAIQTDAGLWHVWTDAAQLQTALIGLACNARDAVTYDTRLRIAAGNITLDVAGIAACGEDEPLAPGDYVRVTVTDYGTGMPEAVLRRVFEPFFSTRPVGGGSGLGLSMVLGTLRQMGGTVRIESTEGQGTTVRLYLRRAS